MRVVVFTMAYNAQATIRRTIESILNQTFEDFQYYVLDNASTDDTEAIILEYAEKDERIVPIHVNKNDPPNGGAFFHTILHATTADYMVWCDADDTYSFDFLENMVNFADENQLDIAACGYRKIDGITGEIIKHRALDENLVIYGHLFTDAFMQYRGFVSYLWGKLYSVSFLKEKKTSGTIRKERICNDSMWTMGLFQKAKRAGVYGKAMYDYYQYPRSLSHINIEQSISSYQDLWLSTKSYLESYGPISKLNEDFLYAIYVSLIDEVTGNIFNAELETKKKLELLKYVFDNDTWKETLEREADPMFHNLTKRKEFVLDIKEKVQKLENIDEYLLQKNNLFKYLDI